MAPLRIEVTGQSTIYRPAERAVVSITVESEGKAQEVVAKDVANTSARVRDILTTLAGKDDKGQALANAPITHWSNSSLSTGSYFDYSDNGKKKTRLHRASMTFEAKFQDFGSLGSVATSLTTIENVSITNISWRLTDKTRQSITAQSRQQAVQDAVGKAKDFAAALDRPPPAVVEIRDSGAPGGIVTQSAMMRYGGAPQSADLDFSPEDVSLECSVVVICEDK